MSAYIVSETGVVTEYQNAGWISWDSGPDHVAILYRSKDDKGKLQGYIARVPRGCLVSFERPFVVQQAHDAKQHSIENAIDITAACVESIPVNWSNRKRLQKLKAILNQFDARSGRWK